MTSHSRSSRRRAAAASTVSLLAATVVAGTVGQTSALAATPVPAGFTVTQLATGPAGLSSPDDITRLGDHLFVAYQNGVGSDGKPSSNGTTKSVIVEYTLTGKQLASWSVVGKVDGMGADTAHERVLASVNEDGNSSLYSVSPGKSSAKQVEHYGYQGLTHGGGTDSVLVTGGKIYITASAPAADADGKTYSKAALYTATLTPGMSGKDGVVALTAVLADNATAVDLVTGKSTKLNLSDPDSSEKVPAAVPGIGGDLLLDSQGDKQLVLLHGGDTPKVLNVSTQVDDTAFATNTTGTLYVVDSGSNRLEAITGHFTAGQAFTSVPGDSDTLKSTLGTIDLASGKITPFASFGSPKGLLFVNETLPAGSGPSTGPSASASVSTTASGTAGPSAAVSASASASQGAAASSTAPALAETGSSGSGTIAAVGAVVVLLGGAALFVTRRRVGRRG
ncbi:LPXTG cell wall anchor domain-containing protein [Streptacidiphilus carbonis]|uniref:LPXTG cell wall anchor domain-containing protein n=1 Tax=Streptacidiphilus carbonis TaxID=105422 RepID=UPI0005AA7584|nr:LPXTG cell wall anchor domain-containing protein [Streptacidiphilus carbonis]